jgi:hypothetical protein
MHRGPFWAIFNAKNDVKRVELHINAVKKGVWRCFGFFGGVFC